VVRSKCARLMPHYIMITPHWHGSESLPSTWHGNLEYHLGTNTGGIIPCKRARSNDQLEFNGGFLTTKIASFVRRCRGNRSDSEVAISVVT
jgi:hypothetical protein